MLSKSLQIDRGGLRHLAPCDHRNRRNRSRRKEPFGRWSAGASFVATTSSANRSEGTDIAPSLTRLSSRSSSQHRLVQSPRSPWQTLSRAPLGNAMRESMQHSPVRCPTPVVRRTTSHPCDAAVGAATAVRFRVEAGGRPSRNQSTSRCLCSPPVRHHRTSLAQERMRRLSVSCSSCFPSSRALLQV
jgi:hypothetical protein